MRNLSTKAARQEALEMKFKMLETGGYSKEVYKGLVLFTKDEEKQFFLKVFKNTSTKIIVNFYYRSAQQRNEAADRAKANFDSSETYRIERKSNPSTHTLCAQAIREDLKGAYPGVKFSVVSSYNSVDVSWLDGPTTTEVDSLIGKYQQGHFNGMEDIYEYSNSRADIPQVNYVSSSRKMSPQVREVLERDAEILMPNWDFSHSGCHTSGNFAYRVFQKYSIPTGAKVVGLESTCVSSGISSPEVFFKLKIEEDKKEQTEIVEFEEPQKAKIYPSTLDVTVINYSEKSIAVVGKDTKKIKETLSAMGGKFNYHLSVGPGWVFPKTKREQLEAGLKEILTPKVITDLQEEIAKTVDFFATMDINRSDEVSRQTKDIADVQGVQLTLVA